MSATTPSKQNLVKALVDLARELPPGMLGGLIAALESSRDNQNLARFATTPAVKEKLGRLEDLCNQPPAINATTLALALQTVAHAVSIVTEENRAEIAWTGPATEAVPLRRVDQVLYDMVESSKEEVLLVTYVAYKAERALKALRDATDRGVRVRLVIELAQESGGKITYDGLPALRAAVPLAQLYCWPLDRRKRTVSGAHGAMHAKCLVVDGNRAIISSANLTDYALETNMELGLLVGRTIAARLAGHFDQLIVRGELSLVY